MNEYDWKVIMISSLLAGVCIVGTIMGFYTFYYPNIPLTMTNMLCGITMGITFTIAFIAFLKRVEIKEFYEQQENDKDE